MCLVLNNQYLSSAIIPLELIDLVARELTICGLVLGDSIRPCTNGVSLLHGIASVALLDHVLTACPIHRAPHGLRGLTVLDDEIRC